jgi:hypothetical protein
MPAPWIKGYDSSTPASARAPKRPSDDAYRAPGEMAEATKRRWKGVPEANPYGRHDDGGGGGGDA